MRTESSVYYGKEPFDLRLTVLRMLRRLPMMIGVTVLGTLLFGGGYYVKNVLLYDDVMYTATSTYQVSYVDEPSKSGDYYINDMTWNTYVDSKEFLDVVWNYLMAESKVYDSMFVTSTEQLANMIDVRLDSDLHVPCTVVTCASPEWTLMIAKSVEQTMIAEFAQGNEQVAAIEVIDPALVAEEVVPDVRPVRAFVLSAILSFFFVVVIVLLKEIGDDSIWLPATIRRRYGIAALGTINSPELKANLEFVLEGKKRIALCGMSQAVNPVEVAECLCTKAEKALIKECTKGLAEKEAGDFTKKCATSSAEKEVSDFTREWIPIPAPILCPEACRVMRKTDGVLLVVKAGKGAGKTLEYGLEYLATQDITVAAVLLWDADEWLLRTYYMLPVTT